MIPRQRYRWPVMGALLALIAGAAAGTGCAARTATTTTRFVRPDTSHRDADARQDTASVDRSLQSYIARIRTLQALPRTKQSLLPTIEATDPGLSNALLRLALVDNAENHRRAAEAYLAVGVRDHAFRHYEKAVALSRCDAASHDGLARLWRDWGAPAQALEEASAGLRCAPGSAALHNTMGTILQQRGLRDRARIEYRKAADLDPSAGFALNNLCYLEIAASRPASAVPLCEAALAASPDLVAASNNLALARTLTGETAAAEATLARAPSAGTVTYNRGVLQFGDGRYAVAAASFEAAAYADPSIAWLARLRAVQSRRADLAERAAREPGGVSGGAR